MRNVLVCGSLFSRDFSRTFTPTFSTRTQPGPSEYVNSYFLKRTKNTTSRTSSKYFIRILSRTPEPWQPRCCCSCLRWRWSRDCSGLLYGRINFKLALPTYNVHLHTISTGGVHTPLGSKSISTLNCEGKCSR